MASGLRVDLLGIEAQRAGGRQEALAEASSASQLTDLDQGRHQPERADGERTLFAVQAVIGLVGAVAEDQSVLGQLVRNRHHRSPHTLVARWQESDEWHQQQRSVQGSRVVVLGEDAAVVEPVGQDVGLDLVGGGLPARGVLEVLAQASQASTAVRRDPAHDLG